MSRLSGNEIVNGVVVNGFDYDLQVWVEGGKVQRCGHPESMMDCCNARRYAGMPIADVPGHSISEEAAQ